MNVHPSSTRQELISYLMGETDPPFLNEETHPVDSWRLGIIGFVGDHWAVLEPQLTCPAKNLRHPTTPDPRPCFGCVDTQVFACIVKNSGRNEHLIQLHRPKGNTR